MAGKESFSNLISGFDPERKETREFPPVNHLNADRMILNLDLAYSSF